MVASQLTLKRCACLLAIIVIVVVGRAASSAQAATAGLRVQGVTLVTNDGTRFIVAGANMEMYRDYDNGCGYVTDDTYAVRSAMADRIKSVGVNAVRLNYAYRFLNQSGKLSRFLDMAQELTKRGIYVMPSDHTYTGGVLTGASASYPMMKQIVEGMRARGLENYLIMNPYNEPGPDISTSQWVQAQKDVLTYLRNTAGFQGVVVMDGTGWATLLDVNAFQQVMSFDASLRGGTANVAFSMHLYPNIPSLPNQLWSAAKQVPLVIGELGQENPGASALDPNYVKTVIAGALNTGIPNGHNGLFAWIWAWCDSNSMLQENASGAAFTSSSALTSHGTLWQSNYYSKLSLTPPPVPTIIAQQPTVTRTNTPRPATATRTSVPVTATRTNTPHPATATRTTIPVTATRTTTPRPVTATATSAATDRTFYRAINLGGGALTLNGKPWEASASAPNLTISSGASQACNTYVNVLPAADAATTQMLQCSLEHWNHAITMSKVPNATYDIYLYTWQDWNDPNPGKTSFSLNSAAMQANYAISKQAGHWEKLGPWRVSVTNGSLKLTSSGDTIKLSGLEVWRVGTGSSGVVMAPTSTAASRAVVPSTATPIGFYRGFNLNGTPVVINGNAWEGHSADVSVSGDQACSTAATITPITDDATSDMLRCYVTGNLNVVVSNIPAGTYDVYAYLWDMPQRYTLTLQGGQAMWFNQPNEHASSWQKVGPWSVTVDSSGKLQLETAGVANLAGLELWRTSASDAAPSQPPVAPTFVPDHPAAPADATRPLTQVIESDDARLIRTGDWQAQSTDKASGGSYLFSSTGRLSFAFTGTQFDVLYVQHPALGSFVIEVDGVALQLVNSRSDQTSFKAVASVRGLADGQHSVAIYPTDGVAAIDAVVLNASLS